MLKALWIVDTYGKLVDLAEGGKIVSRFNSKRILGGASDER